MQFILLTPFCSELPLSFSLPGLSPLWKNPVVFNMFSAIVGRVSITSWSWLRMIRKSLEVPCLDDLPLRRTRYIPSYIPDTLLSWKGLVQTVDGLSKLYEQ